MENPKLALIPSGYKSGKVYSILPTDGVGDFDFSRGSIATIVNKDGLIETVTNNVPRLDLWNSDCPSLLLEPQRLNEFTWSEEFNNSVWFKSNSTIEINQIIAPDGTMTADKLTSTASGGGVFKFGAWQTTQKTISIFVKKNSSNTAEIFNASSPSNRVLFDLNNGTISTQGGTMTGKIEDFANNWYRLSATHTATGSQTFGLKPSPNLSLFIWGAQSESAAYSTSYIKTTGSTVTRLKDVCINSGDADLFNSVEGVIYAEFKNHTELGSFRQINLRLNSTNRIYISKRSDNGSLEFRMENPLGQKSYSFIQNTSDDFVKIAFRYAPNNFGVFINGVNKNISSSGNTFASGTLSTLEFASPISNQNFYGKVKDLRVYNKALTNDELIQLTTI